MLKVLEVALSYVGWKETNGNNINPFAEYLDKIEGFYNGKKNGYAYCDIFVDACMVKAYGRELAQKLLCQPDYSAGAGCTYSARYYQQAGRWSTTPQVGAQIFFGTAAESYHTGLVYAVDETNVYTVEGNSSDMVAKRAYLRGAGNIYGYGVPDYSLVEDGGAGDHAPEGTKRQGEENVAVAGSPLRDDKDYGEDYGEDDEAVYATEDGDGGKGPLKGLSGNYEEKGLPLSQPLPYSAGGGIMCSTFLPELSEGDMSEDVRAMQHLLILRGFSVGNYGPDGEFGPDTARALRRFQAAAGLEVDGVCGALSWAALIRG